MTAHETVLQAIRAWATTVLGWTTSQAADLIIPADRGPEKGRRPPVPYLVVHLNLFGQVVGTDEKALRGTGRYTKGDRRGRAMIEGFGLETSDWLESLAMNVDLTSAPLTVNVYGEIIDISEIAGSHIEARYAREFDVGYALIDGPRELTEATAVTSSVEYDEDDETITVPLNVDLT